MAEVLTPGDVGYPAAVAGLSISAHSSASSPAAVLRASDPMTAAEAVRWAGERGLRIRVRAGGHHLSLPIPESATAVLDLSEMKQFEYDPGDGTAWLGTGLTSLEAARALATVGRAFPVGHAPTVGIGGFLLAGGHGWNPGGWGTATGRVLAAELITPAGELIIVDADHRPDLLELLRGAGPLFAGVVTRFRVHTEPAPEMIIRRRWQCPGDAAVAVGAVVRTARRELPRAVEVSCFVHRRRESGPAVEVVATLFGSTPMQLEPLAGLDPYAEARETSTFRSTAELLAGLDPRAGEAMVSDHVWTGADHEDLLPLLVRTVADCPTTRSSVLVSAAGDGAVLGVAAYGHWVPGGEGCDGTDHPHRRWARETVDRVPDGRGSYVGEADLGRPGGVARCFTEEELRRLRARIEQGAGEGLLPKR
ncbi:MAG: FAD-binding oxidoreductase [Propionibacteriaceae bacterium]